jgi:hypothetical protein
MWMLSTLNACHPVATACAGIMREMTSLFSLQIDHHLIAHLLDHIYVCVNFGRCDTRRLVVGVISRDGCQNNLRNSR